MSDDSIMAEHCSIIALRPQTYHWIAVDYSVLMPAIEMARRRQETWIEVPEIVIPTQNHDEVIIDPTSLLVDEIVRVHARPNFENAETAMNYQDARKRAADRWPDIFKQWETA